MWSRVLSTIALLFATGAASPGGARFLLASLSGNEARITVELSPGSRRRSAPWLIAFSSLPGHDFSATIAYGNGTSFPLARHAAGWAGADYLQWCSFAPDHDSGADTTLHAVITIRFSEPLFGGVSPQRVSFDNRILRVPLARPLRKTAAGLSQLPFTSGLRMEVDRDGIYELAVPVLREHGVPVERISSRTYRLFEGDRELPLLIPNEHHRILTDDDRLVFYGQQLRASPGKPEQYSASNVYWLTWGASVGARVAVVPGGRRVDPTVYAVSRSVNARDYYDTLHIEQDNTIMWLGNVADRPPEELTGPPGAAEADFDNWYWGIVGATALTTFTFTIPSPVVRGEARMRVGLMGLSSLDSVAEDHHLDLFINDKPVSGRNSARWDGQRFFVFESDTFSTDNLIHGENRLTLQTSRSFADRSALNWIDIAYERGYESIDDQVRFKNDARSAGTTVEYALSGFSTDRLELWDVIHHRFFTGTLIEKGSGRERNTRTLIFQDSVGSPVTYFAQAIDKRLVPHTMSLDTVRSDWDTLARVDYIAVGADSFKTDLEPLLRVHRKNGLRTAFVGIDDIYNRFSGGVRNPESIRRFLQYLFSRLTGHPPRYLLLGGDTTHDLDKNNRSRNIVPTHLSRIPGWGPGADDGYFATVNDGDQFPDLSVGRFPARSRAEMRLLVDKTVRYISRPSRGYWRDNLLMLGGGEPAFTQFNDEAAVESVGARMNIVRMDADPASRFYKDGFVAPQLIAGQLNAGVFMVNFNGHGGGNIWSDNNFFGYNELSLLHNGQWGGGGRLPVIFSFTCLTGFFESSEYRSLGEEFLRTDNNGAIAFYGASAYTSRGGNLIMNKLLLEEALGGAPRRLGDLIDYCEMSMLVRYTSQYLALVRQYNLLGDPALPWALTPDTLAFTESLIDSNAVLTLNGNCMPVSTGEVKLSLVAADNAWNQTIVAANDGTFGGSFRLKEQMQSTLATVRAYAWNDSAEVRGWMPFVKDTLLVHDVRIDPARPFFDDSITVSCELATMFPEAQGQLYCLHAQAAGNDPHVAFTGMSMVAGPDGRWSTTGKIALPYTGSINDRLQLYFRVLAPERTLQSPIISFSIGGRPDLTFIDKTLRIVWRDDSLRIAVEVLNTGNAASPPSAVAFLWTRDAMPPDTFAVADSPDSLSPGARRTFTVALSDTQGDLSFSALINPAVAFSEIECDNNRLDGQTSVFYRDVQSTNDTLSIDSGRLRLSPARQFERQHRLFIFEDTVAAPQPLITPSQWIALRAALPVQWHLTSRPPLSAGDSLLWIWNRSRAGGLFPADSIFKKSGFMLFDTIIRQWRFYTGITQPPPERPGAVSMTTVLRGSFTLASVADAAPAEMMVSVYGKSLSQQEYTAKDRPFTIFFSDPSGILPPSVELFLNNQRLSPSSHAAVPTTGDLRSISISAYPEAQRRVDSLRVQCSDLAGNLAKRTFTYLPGSDLTIRSFSCHPNPFTGRRNGNGTISKIRFAFLLTDLAQTATLSIYTVSGKKIRTWSLNELIGYQQVEWDGRDFEGYRLANGTYYAKLIAKNDRKKVKKIIRIAKLEGF
ncbi:MAG: hypothetical protein JW913_04680 [Chitinispirillaceae bacterium]|nr:hypothetical protein [Chitinispirillaceae bacterium]